MKIIVQCDFCQTNKAKYDAKSVYGPWAYMCPSCFNKYRIKVGGLFTIINDEIKDEVNQLGGTQ